MSPSSQMYQIARRDFLQRAKSKAFLATMAVILAVILIGGPLLSNLAESDPSRDVGIVGDAQVLTTPIEQSGEAVGLEISTVEFADVDEGEAALEEGEVDAVVVPGDPAEIIWRSEPDGALERALTAALVAVDRQMVVQSLGLTPAEQRELLTATPPESRSLQMRDEQDDVRQAVAFVAMLLLYMSVIVFGQFVMLGVMEEKSSRVVEVLLSRVRPHHLLVGKIAGIGALALLQILVLAVSLYVVATHFLLDDVDASIEISLILPMLGWFLVGFTFYAVLYAALGSTVTRQEDAQSVGLLPILLILPAYFIGIIAIEDPESMLVRVASIVPPLSPFVMPVRSAATDLPLWEIGLSVALILAATYGMIRLAGRVYQGAILSIGAKVSLRQAWRASQTD